MQVQRERLDALRIAAGLTKDGLADRAGVSRRALRYIQLRGTANRGTVRLLADALDVDTSEIATSTVEPVADAS
jgi:transcriptional regulator with XRE-family HTH domain